MISQNRKAGELLPTTSEWEQLSVMPEKRAAFSNDLYLRECWADLAEIFGTDLMGVLGSLAILNVKPDAVVGRRMRAVLNFVVDHGFVPIAAVSLCLTRHSMRELWRYDWHVYPVDRLAFSTLWYTSTDILLFVLQDHQPSNSVPAAARLSELKGHAVAEKRTCSDLRSVLRPPNGVLNFVHVAEEPIDVVRELGILLDRSERKRLIRDIKQHSDTDRCAEVLTEIARLEARYPEHDLDLSSSLRRLQASAPKSSEAIERLSRLIQTGEAMSWDDLCSMVDPMSSDIDRWDFICVASNAIRIQRDMDRDLPRFRGVDVPRDS